MADIVHETSAVVTGSKVNGFVYESFVTVGRLNLGVLRGLVKVATEAGFPDDAVVDTGTDMVRVSHGRQAAVEGR